MLIARLAKILISLSLALFCLLVAYDNVTDPHSNYEFVTHVMSMDTTFPDNKLMYRSVTNPIFWQIVYALIITTQFVFGVLTRGDVVEVHCQTVARRVGMDFEPRRERRIKYLEVDSHVFGYGFVKFPVHNRNGCLREFFPRTLTQEFSLRFV
jgi:predicted small integral membrane protein